MKKKVLRFQICVNFRQLKNGAWYSVFLSLKEYKIPVLYCRYSTRSNAIRGVSLYAKKHGYTEIKEMQ